MIKNALISVYDKDGVLEFAKFLKELGVEIISTSKTAKFLIDNGVDVRLVEEITGFPEILGGRVKTLSPKIHGGILARRDNKNDIDQIKKFNIPLIDMVVTNLYPFFEKAEERLSLEEIIEYIDIGGPTMIRAAAKNYKDVAVVVDKSDYKTITQELKESGDLSIATKAKLAFKAFNLTSAYDSAISNYFMRDEERFPEYFNLPLKKVSELRYGENPHQKAAYYKNILSKGSMNNFEQLWGKELSYNNLKDVDIAWKLASEFTDETVCCGLKHNSPCGVAVGENTLDAYKKMFSCDPISIFGGIIAFNKKVDLDTAKEMKKLFFEVLIAPDFDEEAFKQFTKKKNLRILKAKTKPQDDIEIVSVDGGVLVQERDKKLIDQWDVVTKVPLNENLKGELIFAYKVAKYAKSNSIVVSKNKMAVGIGSGQVNRIWAAVEALERGEGAVVLASDGFFPFDDVVKEAAKHNIKAIIQPGGSIRDKDSIKVCNETNIAMVMTKTRHFKH